MKQLNKNDAQKRILKLREVIDDYRYQYHVHNTSTMSEAAADGLKHELSQLESQYPDLITPDSPTQRVAGEALPEFTSIKHSRRMLSLNDVFNKDEVEAWDARIKKLLNVGSLQYFVDLKMDGFAVALRYTNGLLEKAITRGDGFMGEDVTQNVRTIESVPLRLKPPKSIPDILDGTLEVRGEILMYNSDFEQLNALQQAKGEPLYKNPRNTAAGTIRQLDARLVAARTLHLHVYDLWDEKAQQQRDHSETYSLLDALGFKVNAQRTLLSSVDEVMKFAQIWEKKRHGLAFGTDGLVIKVNQRDYYERAGVVGKAPRAAVAFKYPAEEATTKVIDIIISVGRTGAATPVAVLEPVDVAGSTVQHASLHNEDEIARKDIRRGDTVIIYKAGDIIPQVKEVFTKLRDGSQVPFNMEQELKDHELEFVRDDNAAVWRATNRNAPSILMRSLQHFASKQALDIEGLGEKSVEALVEAGLVHDLADIFRLSFGDVIKLDRFAEISAHKLIDAIANVKQPDASRFLFGLGIRHVGQQTSIDLLSRFQSIDTIKQAAQTTPEALYEVDGIGEVVAHSLVEWFLDEQNITLLEKFKALSVWPPIFKKTSGPLEGMSFVITGTLAGMSRDEAADRIRSLGGTFQASVGRGTTYLVHGKNLGESKRKKADKFGVSLMDEATFIKKLQLK